MLLFEFFPAVVLLVSAIVFVALLVANLRAGEDESREADRTPSAGEGL